MLRPSCDHADADVVTRRDVLKGSLAGFAAIALGARQSRAADIPDNPFSANNEYPYLFSPLEFHAHLEQKHIPANNRATEVIGIADEIAERVKFLLHRHLKYKRHAPTGSPDQSLHVASLQWETIDQYMHIMAGEIVKEGFTYQSSCSYHNGIVAKEKYNYWPLDCDLTSHIGLHIAKQHRMPIAGAESFCHMYLCSKNSHRVFEMTQLKNPAEFIQNHQIKKNRDHLTDAAAALLQYYGPMSEQKLRQLIAGNILYEIRQKAHTSADKANALDATCTAGEQMIKDYGAGYYLVSNLITAHEEAAKQHTSAQSAIIDAVTAGYHTMRKDMLKKQHAKILQAPFEQW